jgi:hypothetical protein
MFGLFKKQKERQPFKANRPFVWWIDDLEHRVCALIDDPDYGLDKVPWPDCEKVYLAIDKEFHDQEIKSKDQTIKQLEDALRDMGEALEFYGKWSSYSQGANFDSNGRYIINSDASYVDDNPPFRSCVYAGGKRARETLQKHSELLSKINKEKKG